MPNIALLPELNKHFSEINYIGSSNGIEKDIIKKYPIITLHCFKIILLASPKLKSLSWATTGIFNFFAAIVWIL